MTLPELKQLPTQEEVDALKAQVNRFKHGVESFNKTGSMNELLSAYIETPKQCLDEHDAKLRMQLDCALKAQVNCLREALTDAAKAPNHTFYYAKEALEATPEQCLAEVKAKAIEEYKQEQAEMTQMELTTKLMVSSI